MLNSRPIPKESVGESSAVTSTEATDQENWICKKCAKKVLLAAGYAVGDQCLSSRGLCKTVISVASSLGSSKQIGENDSKSRDLPL